MSEESSSPHGELTIRTLAMPADTNPSGDIFGGWLMAQMDLAGGMAAWKRARGRVATVGVTSMSFHRPVRVGDVLSVYTHVVKVGTTSITVEVEAWEESRDVDRPPVKVTEGMFTFVALDEAGQKRPVSKG